MTKYTPKLEASYKTVVRAKSKPAEMIRLFSITLLGLFNVLCASRKLDVHISIYSTVMLTVCLFVCLFIEPVPISYRKMTKLSSECEYGWYLQECSLSIQSSVKLQLQLCQSIFIIYDRYRIYILACFQNCKSPTFCTMYWNGLKILNKLNFINKVIKR